MADNTWTPVGASTDASDIANWSLGWVPQVGDAMVFDGSVSNNNCNFGSGGYVAISCDSVRTQNAYGGSVTLVNANWLISGTVSLDCLLANVYSTSRYVQANDLKLGSSADITGAGFVFVSEPTAGNGLSQFAAGARLRPNSNFRYAHRHAGQVFIAGTIETEVLIYTERTPSAALPLGAGSHTWNSLILRQATTHTTALDLGSNNPSVTILGNWTIDIDSTGGIVLTASSNPITLQGSLVNQITGGGTLTADSQSLTFSGTAAQSIDGCGGTWGAVIENKTAETVTLTGALACASFTGTDGNLDLNGQTLTAIGAVSFASGFTLADSVGSTINCNTFSANGQDLSGSGTWYLNAASSGTATGVTFANCDASGGAEIDASDGTCTDAGGNTNIAFGAFGALATGAIEQEFIHPAIAYQFVR